MSFRIINSDCLDAMRTMQESSVDAIVTDPPYGLSFMGSGTTAVACKELNRHYIGFEISADYCSLAGRRLNSDEQAGGEKESKDESRNTGDLCPDDRKEFKNLLD